MQLTTDTHIHTIASTHAYSTVTEICQQAERKNLDLVAITDHGPAMPDSPHPWHFINMKVMPRRIHDVFVLRGMEANIHEDGSLDIPEFPGFNLDMIIASLHTPVFPPSSKKEHTQAVIKAISSGKCQIIGHPGNPAFEIDIDEVVKAAKDHNVLLEINNSSFHLSRKGSSHNCRKIVDSIMKHDWKVSVSSDSHFHHSVGEFQFCKELLLETEFPQENITTATAGKFLKFLGEHGKKIQLDSI